MPKEHVKHDVAPSVAEKLPAGQSAQADPGVGEYLPAAHFVHAVLSTLDSIEVVPAGQFAQTVESVTVLDVAPGKAYLLMGQETVPEQLALESPVTEPYFPAAHRRQITLSNVYEPKGHLVHSAADMLPVADMLPSAEIVPSGQIAHTVESARSDDGAPGIAYLPAGQVTVPEQLLEVSPVPVPYLPAGQAVQIALPASALYEPAAQMVHPLGAPLVTPAVPP